MRVVTIPPSSSGTQIIQTMMPNVQTMIKQGEAKTKNRFLLTEITSNIKETLAYPVSFVLLFLLDS